MLQGWGCMANSMLIFNDHANNKALAAATQRLPEDGRKSSFQESERGGGVGEEVHFNVLL